MKKALSNKIKVIAIVGPTASGKTKYSIELAKKIGGEIISADSRQIFKDFNIGSAKPTESEMEGIPHYMISIVEPSFDYSAGLFKQQASDLIVDINRRGNVPIIVGGTGLYIDTLLKGFNLPGVEADNNLRANLDKLSTSDLYNLLEQKDIECCTKIEKNDRKKLIRAIEIVTLTGVPLNKSRSISESPYDVKWIGKNFDRTILYKRINDRVDKMLEDGLIDETKMLISKYGKVYNLINTIGYKEIIQYLDGIMPLEESVELLKKNTRNYAKRQLTWFRRNSDIKWDTYPEKLKK